MLIEPVILQGEHVRLEPMRYDHLDALCGAGLDDGLWEWTVNECRTRDDMQKYLNTAMDEFSRRSSLPFVTIDRAAGTVVGSTRFGNIDAHNKKCEIGWTWINPKFQRTYINTEAKLLMLSHAFETWGCIRVELKTDALNERSRAAIERIGGVQEGIFRSHMIADSGRIRDTVYYSILPVEWPAIKARLSRRLNGPG
jgi:RimJ/RimL family protein N-acetyltransferase